MNRISTSGFLSTISIRIPIKEQWKRLLDNTLKEPALVKPPNYIWQSLIGEIDPTASRAEHLSSNH